jgi:signal transduction histidine kinase
MIDSTLKYSNILIVDDQQANIDVLTGLLDVKGFLNYKTIKDPRQTIEIYKDYKPDLLLLDLNMPYLTGFQVMHQLKEIIPSETYFPILVLTADISPESKQTALSDGACDFLTKPFDLIEVDIRIKNLLKTRYFQQQLENQNQILEEKVKERTLELVKTNVDLKTAKENAEEMNRLKSIFLANMSHELRTPLIGISGFSDILQQEITSPELQNMAKIIYASSRRLSDTLNLILDLSKLESGEMKFHKNPIDIVNQTDNLVEIFMEEARKKGIELKASFSQPSIIINTDEQAYRAILTNLINNAIKFTKKGGISTEICLKDDFVEIKVVDTGIGIDKDNQHLIFGEFRQVSEGFTRKFEGTGLGLNITKKLVELAGGEIFVESELEKGSTFTVKLPTALVEK